MLRISNDNSEVSDIVERKAVFNLEKELSVVAVVTGKVCRDK